ncbi:DUF4082 domain-containing protein [Ensifer sp. IC3342]|nr:DUF4082 domain-containing protein [Ensifer sp. IC3342]
MRGDDRWWDLRSILSDSSVLRRLAVDVEARSRSATRESDGHSKLARTMPIAQRNDTARDNGHHRSQHGGLISKTCGQVDVDYASLSLGGAAATGRGAVAPSTDSFRAASLLTSAGSINHPRDLSPLQSHVHTAPEARTPFVASESPTSNVMVIQATTPSATTDIVGSSVPVGFMPVAVPNATPGSILQADGRVPGTRLNVGADYVPSRHGIFGTSTSDPLLLRNVAPLAAWKERLPGSRETAGLMTGLIGTLPGSLTRAAVAPDTSQNLVAAAAATNPIVLENEKPGNPQSEWGIDGAGSSNIEGFATDISVNRGQTVSFKINTNSSNYRIDIYRLGYYGGMGARKVATIQHTGVQNQPTPLRDSTTGLVDAGNWSVSASWAIPADAVSGIYIAKLVRQDGTAGQNHIPFIVRDDSSHSDIVFQTSDETWQAYNPWGGANLYQGNGPATDSAPGRAYAVSYNRPITTRGGGLAAGPQDFIFGVEYPAIRWLEKNGYDVSYMAGMDSDRFGSLIQNHKMFLSVGHDEYWSGQQRANVEAARDAGVNLCFWSGNEVYWETRFAPSISAGAQAYRTLVCYKETRAGPIDPDNQWTGTYRDPRFVSPTAVGGGRPENALTGTMFQVDSYRSDAITIPYDDANLRFWRDTSVANLQPGQTATLERNYLGYEWDESPDNGFRPAGLIELSSTTLPVNEYLLDYGTATGAATATHNLTLYRAPSGALVFGAGTVYWAWGLDENHDLEATPADPRVKQAMVNLLADMGIQPGTLEAGLVSATQSTDTTRPVSSITAPNDGTALKVGNAVTISGTASDVGGVVAAVEVSTDGGTTWHRAVGDETWTYSWVAPRAGSFTIKTRAVDDSLNLETPGVGRTVTITGSNFFPVSAIPPIVPDADAKPIEVGMKFQSSVAGTVTGVRYYKSDLNIGPHTGSLWSSTGTKLATVTFTNESGVGWQAASFSNPVAITAGTTYVVSYHTNYGHYTATANYFASPVTNGPLTAPANAGVYTYNSASAFPSSTFNGENYWVDVLFNPASANTAPTAVADMGDATEKGGIANGSGGAPASGNVLTNDTDPDAGDTKTVTAVRFGTTTGTLGTALAGAHGSLVLNASGAFTYSVNENDAAVQALRQSTNTLTDVFSYTMRDAAGATSTATLTVTIHGANDAPVLAAQTANQNAVVDTAFSLVLPASTFTDVDSGDTLAYTATAADGSPLPGWLSFNASTRTFSGTPTAADVGTLAIRVTAADLGSLAASETFNITVTPTPNTTPTAVADTGDATEKGGIANGSGGAPASGNVLTNDTDPDAGDTKTVTAVRFGTTTGTLGTALAGAHGSLVLNASGAFTYSVNENDAAVQALRQSTNTLTDVFSYTMRDAAGATSTATLTVTIHGANDAPVLAAQTANQNAVVDTAFSLVLPASTFTDVDSGDTLTYTATAADGSPLPGWLSFNASTRTFSGTPTAADVGTLAIRVTAADLGSLAASETFNIAVSTAPTTYSLFSASSTPAQASLNDGRQLEVGVKFQANVAGQITALKFYRSSSDTGQNVLDLWTATGTKLASATFTNTAASGWQTVALSTPVSISANTTYVASYHTTGFYVATDNFFTGAVTNGPLTAPSSAAAGGNGVYAYGGSSTTGLFPTDTFASANYWADVVFRPQLAV